MSDSRVHCRSARSGAEHSASLAWKRKTGFRLPQDVFFEKQRLSAAWAYVFRHRMLGELGRILLQELDDGRCHISCEKRRDRSTRPPEAKEVIESKIIPCERCGAVVTMLIFAPEATDPGRFEDYARKMYPQYNSLNVPTWFIGPALGEGPLIERPADVLKVWPRREPIQRLTSAQFNPLLDQLITRHCR